MVSVTAKVPPSWRVDSVGVGATLFSTRHEVASIMEEKMWQDDEKYGPLMRALFWPVEDCVHRLVRDGCRPEMAGAHDPNTGPLARTYGIYAPARWDLLARSAKKILESSGWSKYQYDAFMYWYDRDASACDHLQVALAALGRPKGKNENHRGMGGQDLRSDRHG